MAGNFKPGDLIVLNEYGFFVTKEYKGIVGIIVSDPYSMVVPQEKTSESFYRVYDILFDGEFLKMVPEDFMAKYCYISKKKE